MSIIISETEFTEDGTTYIHSIFEDGSEVITEKI